MRKCFLARSYTSMQRRVALACIIFYTAFCPFAGVSYATPGVSAYERAARHSFDEMTDREVANTEYLDDFIKTYVGTQQADLAFTLRFNITRSGFSVTDYNNFIQAYPNTIAGRLAVLEVYELYQLRDEVPSYVDFMRRYPNSPEALHAKLRVHYLMFEFAKAAYEAKIKDEDKIQALDDFIDVNQGAPQTPAAEMMLKMVRVQQEQAWQQTEFDKTIKRGASGDILRPDVIDATKDTIARKRANVLAAKFERFESVLDDVKSGDDAALKAVAKTIRQADREAFVLLALYSDQDAAGRIRNEERYQNIYKKLNSIENNIILGNKNIVDTLHQEFAETRKTLQEGFATLHTDMTSMNQKLDLVTERLNQLHSDFVIANNTLVTISQQNHELINAVTNQTVTVANAIAQTNQLVAKNIEATDKLTHVMHDDLNYVRASIEAVNRDLNKGFEDQGVAMKGLTDRVQSGFKQLHSDNEESYKISLQQLETQQTSRNVLIQSLRTQEQSLQELTNTKVVLNDSLNRINNTLGVGFTNVQNQLSETNTHLGEIDQNITVTNQKLTDQGNTLRQSLQVQIDSRETLSQSLEEQRKQYSELKKIGNNTAESNTRLAILDTSIHGVENQLIDVNQGIKSGNDKLDTLYTVGTAQLEHLQSIRDEQVNTRVALAGNLQKIDQSLKTGFGEVTDNLRTVSSQIADTNNKLDVTNQSLYKIDKTLYSIDGTTKETHDELVTHRAILLAQKDELTRTRVDLGNKLSNINASIDTNTQVIGTKIDTTNNQLVGVNNQLNNVNSNIVDGNRKLDLVNGQLDTQIKATAQYHLEDMRQNDQLHQNLINRMDKNTSDMIASSHNDSMTIKNSLDTGFSATNYNIKDMTNRMVSSMYDNTQAINSTIDRNGSAIVNVVNDGNNKIVYKLDQVNNSVQSGTTQVGQQITQFAGQFNQFAQTNTSVTASLLRQAIANSQIAGQAGTSDYLRVLNNLMGSVSGNTVSGATGGFDPNWAGMAQSGAVAVCNAYNAKNDIKMNCNEVSNMASAGGFNSGSVAGIASNMGCQQMEKMITVTVDCNQASNLIKGFVTDGAVSPGSIADFGARTLCSNCNLDVNCQSLGTIVGAGTDICTGDYMGAVRTVGDAVFDSKYAPKEVTAVYDAAKSVGGGVVNSAVDIGSSAISAISSWF